ncbi:MAG TPA: DUF1998 domain-containing protein [Gemmataceae bacterium]|jgi:hypothetical protein
MNNRRSKKAPGQLRQGQIVSTFGPGAMLDLPNHSVLIAGLEHWTGVTDEIVEPRLADKLCMLLDLSSIKLYAPPADPQDPTAPQNGIAAWQFPEWFIVQEASTGDDGSPFRTRMMVHRSALTGGKFIDLNKKRRAVVPIRFVRACRCGHIGDIDWRVFVHGAATDCKRQLWIDERGTSGDLGEVWIRCECKTERSMSQAAIMQNRALGHCNGNRPWLGPVEKEQCGEPNRLLIRNASNAYFPQLLSVISLPDRDDRIKQAVDSIWDTLEAVENIDELRYERKKAKVKAALEDLTDEEVLAEIHARTKGHSEQTKTVKQAELETLIAAKPELGNDQPDGTFFARTLAPENWRTAQTPWMNAIERVVLVHRLREVVAQVGFTRFEAAAPDIEGELEIGVRRAALARETAWLPASENKGEGVFLQFKREFVDQWLARPQVQARGRQLDSGFNAWVAEHQGTHRKFPGLPYIMLHSFSHLLITAVSLECGYPASSIRERIYALPSVGYGVLLYTGTSDSEGTLGGLVEVGRRIHEHMHKALDMGELCSNDPVCAEHQPENRHERRFLQGAACHGCLLIAETSCEQHNDFLDRALVVPTLENLGVEFFNLATK